MKTKAGASRLARPPRLPLRSEVGDSYTLTLVPGYNAIANQLVQSNSTLGALLSSMPAGESEEL